MRRSVVAVYDSNKQDYVKAIPYIYNGTEWVPVRGKIYYDSAWQDIGGAGELFYNFLEQEGNYYNSTDNILVREGAYDRWVDKNGQPIMVTDNNVTTGDPAHAYYVFEHTVERLTLQDSDLKNLKDTDGRQLIVLEDV